MDVDGLTPSSVCTVTLQYGVFFVLAIVLEDFFELLLKCILTRNGAKYLFSMQTDIKHIIDHDTL